MLRVRPHLTDHPIFAHNQVKMLVEIGRALRENPWRFAVVLCAYLDGYFINTVTPGTFASVWVFPELATGLVWVCLITAIMVAATGEVVPPTRIAACYCTVASLIAATGTLGVVIVARAARIVLSALANAVPELHGRYLRLLVDSASTAVAIILSVLFFVIVTRAFRKAIRSLARRPQSHDPADAL